MSEPAFAVVGHANPGKSSIVSTLAADDSVRIGALPGTTRQCKEFPMRVNGELLYTLIDTPGFERPRALLQWLREQETSTAGRRQTLESVVRQARDQNKLPHECELLKPILAGAAILYVVDGSKPPSTMNEAEMEILRWTGQPRMALINPVDADDYSADWHSVLDQYFNLVRVFNANQADFDKRLELLQALRELNGQWREKLDRAINALTDDRQRCMRESAAVISETLVDMLTYTDKTHLPNENCIQDASAKLEKRYYQWLREREQKGHQHLQQVYGHHQITIESISPPIVKEDLFSKTTTNRLGLSRKQIVAAAAAGGAAVGSVIDAGVGGISFLTGTIIGGAAGTAAGLYGISKLPKAILGGDALQIGPMSNANFPWIVLDRAILVHSVLSRRAHAQRENIRLGDPNETPGIVSGLSAAERKRIGEHFSRLRKQSAKQWPSIQAIDGTRRELSEEILAILHQLLS